MLRPTRCCSALALIAISTSAVAGDSEPLSLFPARTAWTLTLSGPLNAAPAFAAARAYVPIASDDPHLAAIDLATGQQLWVVKANVRTRPAVGDGLVFVVEPDALTALHESDGSRVWRLPLPEPLSQPLVWDNGWLIAAAESGAISAFRASDGHLVWRHDVGSPLRAPPSLAADSVYLPAADGRVLALRIDTGSPVWERRLGEPPNDLLALDDRVYVGSQDNFFYCLDTRTGVVDWRFPTGGDVTGLPVVDDRRVYF